MLDSGLLATAVKVSKSCHNSTIKSLIQNSPILFQDNIAISLHCTFQPLMFSDCRENANSISRIDTLTHTHTHDDYHMPPVGSAHRGIIICEVHWWRPGMVASLGQFSNSFKSTLQQLIVATTSSGMMPACDRCTAITRYLYFSPPTNYCLKKNNCDRTILSSNILWEHIPPMFPVVPPILQLTIRRVCSGVSVSPARQTM